MYVITLTLQEVASHIQGDTAGPMHTSTFANTVEPVVAFPLSVLLLAASGGLQ